jgi:hypothetical protein
VGGEGSGGAAGTGEVRPWIAHQIRRLWNVSSPSCERKQAGAYSFNRVALSTIFTLASLQASRIVVACDTELYTGMDKEGCRPCTMKIDQPTRVHPGR